MEHFTPCGYKKKYWYTVIEQRYLSLLYGQIETLKQFVSLSWNNFKYWF